MRPVPLAGAEAARATGSRRRASCACASSYQFNRLSCFFARASSAGASACWLGNGHAASVATGGQQRQPQRVRATLVPRAGSRGGGTSSEKPVGAFKCPPLLCLAKARSSSMTSTASARRSRAFSSPLSAPSGGASGDASSARALLPRLFSSMRGLWRIFSEETPSIATSEGTCDK
jgi:hypothetical protein